MKCAIELHDCTTFCMGWWNEGRARREDSSFVSLQDAPNGKGRAYWYCNRHNVIYQTPQIRWKPNIRRKFKVISRLGLESLIDHRGMMIYKRNRLRYGIRRNRR